MFVSNTDFEIWKVKKMLIYCQTNLDNKISVWHMRQLHTWRKSYGNCVANNVTYLIYGDERQLSDMA